jgi:hypothetical protein
MISIKGLSADGVIYSDFLEVRKDERKKETRTSLNLTRNRSKNAAALRMKTNAGTFLAVDERMHCTLRLYNSDHFSHMKSAITILNQQGQHRILILSAGEA